MLYLNAFLIVVIIGMAVFIHNLLISYPKIEPYYQNQMVDGCVMQKSFNTWIRTCG
jgi:hypothetical protein